MPFFKVRIRKALGIVGGHGRYINPFDIVDLENLTSRTIERIWENMEAKDENAIRAFFAEAQSQGLHCGFEISSISEVRNPTLVG